MGARLVTLVLTRWTHVSDRAFRVLVRMAHTALDEPNNGTPAGLYFGGRDLLADTLRNERGGQRASVLRVVRYAVDELIEEGAIERASAGRAGNNAVYRMTLTASRSIDNAPMNTQTQGESSVPPQEECHVPPEGESSVPEWGNAGFPPRNHEEPLEELREERRDEVRTAVTVARAPEADANPDSTPDAPTEPTRLTVINGHAAAARPAVGSRRWTSRGMDVIAEAAARRQAAIAAHRAREAAGE